MGEHWDLNEPNDIKELKEMVDYEEPFLLTGSPPCDPFSQLLKISAHRRNPAKVWAFRIYMQLSNSTEISTPIIVMTCTNSLKVQIVGMIPR